MIYTTHIFVVVVVIAVADYTRRNLVTRTELDELCKRDTHNIIELSCAMQPSGVSTDRVKK